MAWIELHQSLWTHRKTLILSSQLGVDDVTAAGYMSRLWCWAVDNAPDGSLEGLPNIVIATGAGWKSDAEIFVVGAITAGFIDDENGVLSLHDWYEYAGRLIEKRNANAERMRKARSEHVQRTCNARAGATVPNRTLPKKKKDIPVQDIVDELNNATGKSFRASSAKTQSLIEARWNEGWQLDDFKSVIHNKSREWRNDPRMAEYLRPETLFGTKFESYLNSVSRLDEVAASREPPILSRVPDGIPPEILAAEEDERLAKRPDTSGIAIVCHSRSSSRAP